MNTDNRINTSVSNLIDLNAIKQHNTGNSVAAQQYQEKLNFAQLIRADTNRSSDDNEARVQALVKPSPGYLAELTGIDYNSAVDMVYGVVGSNKDMRDWQAIMTSDDPLNTLRAETAKMYNSGANYADPMNNHKLNPSDTIAVKGNYALEQSKNSQGDVIYQGLTLVDSQGMILRSAGSSAEQIRHNNWLFGFNQQDIADLLPAAQQLSDSLGQAMAQVVAPTSNVGNTLNMPTGNQAANTADTSVSASHEATNSATGSVANTLANGVSSNVANNNIDNSTDQGVNNSTSSSLQQMSNTLEQLKNQLLTQGPTTMAGYQALLAQMQALL